MNDPHFKDEREGIPSASRLERLKLCPGSFHAEAACTPLSETEDASRGSRIHAACVTILEEKFTDPLQDEENALAMRCVSSYQHVFQEVLPEKTTRIAEKRFWLLQDGKKILSGKCDVVDFSEDEALIADFKTGWLEVSSAKSNLQMRGYAVLLKENFPHLEKIHVAIIQPNTGKPTLATYESGDLAKSKEEILSILEIAKDENAPRLAGNTQCKYCSAKFSCKEYSDTMLAPMPVIPRGTLAHSAKEWTPQQRAKFCDVLPEITSWIEERKSELKEMAKNGLVPGWTVATGRKTQKCKDASKAFQLVSDTLDASSFAACCTISLPKLRKAYAKSVNLSEMAAKDVINMRLNGLIEETQAEGSLERIA